MSMEAGDEQYGQERSAGSVVRDRNPPRRRDTVEVFFKSCKTNQSVFIS